MKKNASLFSLVAVLFILALFTNLSATDGGVPANRRDGDASACLSAENPIPQGLSDLLSGKTTDPQAVLSGLDDAQIPEAMALCEVLRHKALHQEINLPPEAVDLFKASLEAKTKSSEVVSFSQTSTHIHRIPAREIVVDGHKLTIPEYYLAPVKFIITENSPQNEAGTLLPDILVRFIGGKPPVTAKVLLDGREIPLQSVKGGFIYRPALHPSSALSVGEHRIEAVLTDASKKSASASWSFSVGMKPVSTPAIPADAVAIGSFSVPVTGLVPGTSSSGAVEVTVFETTDGKRILEYRLPGGSGKDQSGIRTTSLFFLHQLIKNPKRQDVLRILPKTGVVFAGRKTRFSYVYSGEGKVTGQAWVAQESLGSEYKAFETPDISWEVLRWSHLDLRVDVEIPVEDTVSYVSFEKHKEIMAIEVTSQNDYSQFVTFETVPAGTVQVIGQRSISNRYTHESKALIEGESFAFPPAGPGTLMVTRSRWKMVGGNAEAVFEEATAAETNLQFSSFGFVEFVHDVAVSYDWEDEHYEMVLEPEESYLYGRFSYKASCEFKQFPPGIIFNTSRYLAFKTIDLEINGEKRVITEQPSWYCPVEPPIRLAESVLFPDADPVVINAVMPIAIRKTATSYAYLPDPYKFRILLKYDKPEQAIKDEIPCRVYFVAGDSGKLKKLRARDEWEDFFGYARPLTDWVGVKTYPNPADLVQVGIDPETPEVYEGQDFKFTGKITPQEGFGTGEFTETTKTLDLLDGYQIQKLESLVWNSKLLPQEQAWKNGQGFTFDFKPKDGTGTYEVIASTVVEVKEKDTGSLAKATGVSSTTAIVKPGLKILSPVDRFFYPLGYPIRVETSMDEDIEEWAKIQWSLNGQQWLPDSIGPKPVLKLEKPGDYVLKAVYKTSDGIELSQEISFSVKPVKVAILPERKVLTFPEALEFPLQGKLDFDGRILEDSEKPLDLGNNVSAKVTKVEWSAVTNPGEGVNVTLDKNLLRPDLKFNRECAVTALATVSISISKEVKIQARSSSKTQVVEESFVLPTVRADLWAIAPLVWTQLNGIFPNQAIAKAGRTFSLKDGSFSCQGNTSIWSQPTGLKEPITLIPAVPNPGVQSPTTKEVRFVWSGPDSQTSEQTPFTPTFKDVGNFDVLLDSFLSFGGDGEIPFNQKKAGVKVVSLESLIDYFIDPPSFVMTIGDTKTFNFRLKALDPHPEPPPGPPGPPVKTEFFLLDNAYKLTLQGVEWSNKLTTKSRRADEFEYLFTPNNIGSPTICATASCLLEEVLVPAKPTTAKFLFLLGCTSAGDVNPPKIELLVNDEPLGSKPYYLGQRVRLSYRTDAQQGNQIKKPLWKISKPVPSKFFIGENNASGLMLELQGFDQSIISFVLFNFDPLENFKSISLQYEYNGKTFTTPEGRLEYKAPIVEFLPAESMSKPIVDTVKDPSSSHFGQWFIGLDRKPKPGVTFFQKVSNFTGIPYTFNCAHLIKINNKRELAVSPPSFERMTTTNEFWLDQDFPSGIPISIDSEPKIISVFNDSPKVYLDNSSADVKNVDAENYFFLHILARPDLYASDWVPVGVIDWSWGGHATKENMIQWKEIEPMSLSVSDAVLPINFLNWFKKADSENNIPPWEKEIP